MMYVLTKHYKTVSSRRLRKVIYDLDTKEVILWAYIDYNGFHFSVDCIHFYNLPADQCRMRQDDYFTKKRKGSKITLVQKPYSHVVNMEFNDYCQIILNHYYEGKQAKKQVINNNITKEIDGNRLILKGLGTINIKERLKDVGMKWDNFKKHWYINVKYQNRIEEVLL